MSDTQNQFAISIMSSDQVGIVYQVSRLISQMDGNISDLSQTVLRGYFTMILLASFPAAVTQAQIKQRLTQADATQNMALEVSIKPVVAPFEYWPATPENTYILTASGRDQPGFVSRVSKFCAQNKINILDIATKVSGDQYIMILMVDLGRASSVEQVKSALEAFSQPNSLVMVLQHYDIFKAVHEVNMP